MPLERGSRLGHYEILSPVGAGGMGEVYKAKDTRLDRTVAIKVLPSHLATDDTLRERFEREAKVISSLSHPNVCTLYDVGREGEVDFLVMEYVAGETLASRLQRGPLALEDALTVGKQIARALAEAHDNGIVHRDLKPANVMITKDGAKLLDFGLARVDTGVVAGADRAELSSAPTEARDLTGEGAIMGTFRYMAPEQVEGHEVSARTDIFSLGVVLYEMVTGRPAFEGDTPAQLMSSVLRSSVLKLSPPLLGAIVSTCLEKDPAKRWASAGDVARQLDFVTLDRGPETRGEERRSVRSAWLAAALVAGVAVGALAVRFTSNETPESAPSRLNVQVPPGQTVDGFVGLTPDGRTLVYRAVEDGTSRLYRRRLDGWESVPIAGTEGLWRRSAAISPDGEWVAFSWPGTIAKVPLEGGSPQTLTSFTSSLYGMHWGPAGRIAYGADSRIYAVSENGGEPSTLTDPADGPAWGPFWLPGGRHLLFSSSEWIETLEIASGRREPLLEGSSPRYVSSGHLLFNRQDEVWVVRFDPATLELLGAAAPLTRGVTLSRYSRVSDFSLSENGDLALLIASGSVDQRLVWVGASGMPTPIQGLPSGNYWEPRLSPDGNRVAVSLSGQRGADVWVLDLMRGSRSQLTFEESNVHPTWSRDGKDVFFLRRDDNTLDRTIFRARADGASDPVPFVEGETLRTWDLAPDGATVALNAGEFGADIMLWTVAEGSRPLMETPASDVAPRFDPSGNYLAYVSDENGELNVYVRSLESGERWQVSLERGDQPVWSPDGRRLFYRRGPEMWSVSVTRDPFELGSPVLLFEADFAGSDARSIPNSMPRYDVALDGRFLMMQAEGDSAVEIRIVLNATSELERLAPRR